MKINLTDEMLVQFKDFKITSENINIRKDTQFKHLITFHFLFHTKNDQKENIYKIDKIINHKLFQFDHVITFPNNF